MGLCKCPKKKVTNQFCFEHRVNVCEFCMITKHPKCVVQSYLQWLQDSDYNPNCPFCQQDLNQEDCVRLTCFHVVHWVCLDKYARELPPTTAPAGYSCPICKDCIFPPENAAGPIVDNLRAVLKDVNWARAGLGLPLLEEKAEKMPQFNKTNVDKDFSVPSGPRPPPEGEISGFNKPSSLINEIPSTPISHSTADQIINFDTPTSRPSVNKERQFNEELMNSPLIKDPDDNKYQRKSGTELLFRWLKNTLTHSGRRRISKKQRYVSIILLLLVAFIVFMVIMSYFNKTAYNDPMLDPMSNPNIRIQDS